jgi:hypothetical protein
MPPSPNDAARAHFRRKAQERLPAEVRRQLLDAIYGGLITNTERPLADGDDVGATRLALFSSMLAAGAVRRAWSPAEYVMEASRRHLLG